MDGEVKRENTANNLVENPLASAFARGFGETSWRGECVT
jgi:hypothetical protein